MRIEAQLSTAILKMITHSAVDCAKVTDTLYIITIFVLAIISGKNEHKWLYLNHKGRNTLFDKFSFKTARKYNYNLNVSSSTLTAI